MARITIPLESLATLPETNRLHVTEDHIDVMGHMNTAYYSILFADASREMTHQAGVTEEYIAERRLGAFMLKNFTQFIAEVHQGEQVVVRTRVVARSEKRYQYMHFMINTSTRKLAATMEVLSTHADLDARRSAPFPLAIATTLDRIIEVHQQIDWTGAPLCGLLSP